MPSMAAAPINAYWLRERDRVLRTVIPVAMNSTLAAPPMLGYPANP